MRPRATITIVLFIMMSAGIAQAQNQNSLTNRMGGLRARQNQNQRVGQIQRNSSFGQQVKQFVQNNRLKSFTKHGKPFVGVKGVSDMKQYTKLGNKNVVEFFVRPGFHHLYTRVPGKAQTGSGTEQWVFSRIGGLSRSTYSPSSSEQIGVLVELNDKEMGNLNKYLDKARANPSKELGPFVYAGGRPPKASNCTSYITCAPIGERGETLARVLGVGESGMPQSFLRSLMSRGNDRVKAIMVHNPPGGEFTERYDMNNALR